MSVNKPNVIKGDLEQPSSGAIAPAAGTSGIIGAFEGVVKAAKLTSANSLGAADAAKAGNLTATVALA